MINVFQDERCIKYINKEPNFQIFINGHPINVIKEILPILSEKFKVLKENEPISISIAELECFHDFHIVEELFKGNPIIILRENFSFLTSIANYFEIDSLCVYLSDLIFDEIIIEKYFLNCKLFKIFSELEETLLLISDPCKLEYSKKKCLNIIPTIGYHFFYPSNRSYMCKLTKDKLF